MLREFDGALPAPGLLYINVEWCGHCRRARPILEKVSDMVGTTVPVISVDGDANKSLLKKLKVNSFPTILYVDPAGHFKKFNGERTVENLVGFICENGSKGGSWGFCGARA